MMWMKSLDNRTLTSSGWDCMNRKTLHKTSPPWKIWNSPKPIGKPICNRHPVSKEWRFFFCNGRRKKLSQRTSQLDPRTEQNGSPKWWNGSLKWWRIFMVFYTNVFCFDGQFHNLLNFNHCYMICIIYNALRHEHMNFTKKYFWLMSWQPIWTKTFVKLVYVVFFWCHAWFAGRHPSWSAAAVFCDEHGII